MASSIASKNEKTVLRQTVVGTRRLSNYLTATACTIGGVGFFLASLSSYLKVNLVLLSDPTQLVFFPQGIALGFYGLAGSAIAAYLWLTMQWDVGGGYNEFDKDKKTATIFRSGFPGKNRKIELVYPIEEIQSVKVEMKEGLSPKRALYLRVKGKGDLPLTRVGQPIALSALENQGAELARFLGVPLEGL
jgi:Ycf4